MTMADVLRCLGDGPAEWYVSLAAAEPSCPGLAEAPRVTRILAENVLRAAATAADPDQAVPAALERVRQLVRSAAGDGAVELDLYPTRLLLQDHSGIPVLADLAALRSAAASSGKDPAEVQPAVPVDLVVDHSVEAHRTAAPDAVAANLDREFALNAERYRFLRWAESAVPRLRVVPPGHGIVHQMHLERLARVVMRDRHGLLAPDLVLGTDSHTPMVNSIGVLGWGVGGIDASAALLGAPTSLLSQPVIEVWLTGTPGPGIMATDIALTMTAWLRSVGVVNAMVEFSGPGVRALSVPDRGTIANMAPEYGCTTAYFPVDEAVLDHLALTGRSADHVALVAAYCRAQGLFAAADPAADTRTPTGHARRLTLDLSTVEPSVAGPRRPQDRVPLSAVAASFPAPPAPHDRGDRPRDGDIAIAAITSCTNTANPRAMLAAGLLARRAVARGLTVPPWVKTSLAPGSRAVSRYLAAAGLSESLSQLGFGEVGYGCTTCIGNSGPLTEVMGEAVARGVRAAAVLSGNRNFESRIHAGVAGAYLMSPALVVAFALAGTVLLDVGRDPLGHDPDGVPVHLEDLWPSDAELADAMAAVSAAAYTARTDDERWANLPAPAGPTFDWPPDSSYLMPSPLVTDRGGRKFGDLAGARVLVFAPDGTTTDHISPAGQIPVRSLAGRYLTDRGIAPADFNSYGCRRGNHEVLVRGTFANPRFRNLLAPGTSGDVTRWLPSGEQLPIHDAAARYADDGVPVVILAGRNYGMGSSRDWAARGPRLLGVRAVLAVDFERIHRSNLVSVGVLPLEFPPGTDPGSLGLTGTEEYHISGIDELTPRGTVTVRAVRADGATTTWQMRARVDTARELAWVRSGGVLRALGDAALGHDTAVPATASG